MRKTLCLLLLAACFVIRMPAAAAENRGSIRIDLDTGDMPVINGAVTLYQVGIETEEGYQIAEGFGGGIVRQDEADSGKLALWLAESADSNGASLLLDADGSAVYSGLEQGLYILVQTERIDGFYPIHPVLLTIPSAEGWDLEINREPAPVVTEIPQTGQSLIPYFGILGMILSGAGLLWCVKKERK